MKKLLLLTTLPLLAFLYSFAGTQGTTDFELSFKDSTEMKAGVRQFDPTDNNLTVKLNPLAISFVQSYMVQYGSMLNRMKTWGRPYFDLMENVLTNHGLPTELKYLSVIESELKASATSWVGAAGPWQLMPQTARDLGLKVSKKKDERRDFTKSTNAAARYLTDLYNTFGDWLLVIAAYNTGPANVNTAIRKAGSSNFWDLQQYLPAETRNHVKKFIATHYIMQGDGSVTTMTKDEIGSPVQPTLYTAGVESINISGKYNSTAIAGILNIDISEFSRLNPNFDKQLAKDGSYNLRLPSEKLASFQNQKDQILGESVKTMLAMASR